MPFTPLSRTGWTAAASTIWDSSFSAAKALDGDTGTCWNSQAGLDYPHSLTIDMGSAQTFNAVQFVPRQDVRADPYKVEVYVSDDGASWGSPVATDRWISSIFTKTLGFQSQTRRYLKLVGLTGHSLSVSMACAELYAGDIPPAESIRQTGVELELTYSASAEETIATQAGLETMLEAPPSSAVRQTQAALEAVAFPPNEIWATQVCLEVLFPAPVPPAPASRRNHSFVGAWMGTGHEDNASFSY